MGTYFNKLLGQYVPDFIKTAFSPATVYLLDGFDEIGAQTWSDDPTKLVEIRKQSLVGVKDLITSARGGVLVTGREHYFNNDAEMLDCLGLTSKAVIVLRCNPELSERQFSDLIGKQIATLPTWLPKKPLIGMIIREIPRELIETLFRTSSGQIDLWDHLLTSFCEREAKINPILDASIIRSLYAQIGRLSRTTITSLGPISIKGINDAFERTTGRPPTDESAIILQRLPGLSRIGAESMDRQFADTYILDGLKAEDVLQIYSESPMDVLSTKWLHPVEEFGAFYLSSQINSTNQALSLAAYVKRHNLTAKNRVLLSDMLSALSRCEKPRSEFGGTTFAGGKFSNLVMLDCPISRIRFEDCHFEQVDITDADSTDVLLVNCTIGSLSGAVSGEHLPAWMNNCLVGQFQSLGTLASLREAGLSVAQTFLLSSLRKLFLQPGSGRRHSSMYKGYADLTTKKICEKVITLLLREKFCSRHQGTTEDLYIPDRSLTGRARSILSQMTQSKDSVWLQASRLMKDEAKL